MTQRSISTPTDDSDDRTYWTQRFSTPFGELEVTINDQTIVASHYIIDPGAVGSGHATRWLSPMVSSSIASHQEDPPAMSDMSEAQRHLFTQIGEQLDEYFSGTRKAFNLPLDVEDDPTEFTKAVREEMAQISPGDVLTYGELAEAAGRPRAARAVGSVCRTNPIQLFIPCHRVVAAGGSLGGYMGGARGLVLKQQLLEREGVPFTANGKVDFQELGRRQ